MEYLTEETTENKIFYNNFYKENPYLLAKPINDKIYNILKYKHINSKFNGSFYEGENREFYRNNFKKLLNNEMPLIVQKNF